MICYPGPAGFAYCDHFIRFRIDEKTLNPVLFAFLFRTALVRNQVEAKMVSSAGQNTVSQGSFREIEVPVPPRSEQDRMAAKIEELLENVNTSRERVAKVPKILKAFRQSVVAAACSGRLTEDWREKHQGIQTTEAAFHQVFAGRDGKREKRTAVTGSAVEPSFAHSLRVVDASELPDIPA